MESQRYVTKHQSTHHFCSRDFAIPISEVSRSRRCLIEKHNHRYESSVSNVYFRRTPPSSCLANLHAGKTEVTCRPLALACVFRLSGFGWLSSVWLSRVRARGSFCIERARWPIRRPTPTKPTTLCLFCLPACLDTPHHRSLRTPTSYTAYTTRPAYTLTTLCSPSFF